MILLEGLLELLHDTTTTAAHVFDRIDITG